MNNSFSDTISNICGLEMSALCGNYKYSVFSGRAAIIEGHCGIIGYSDAEVSFAIKNAVLRIRGRNLRIKCLEKHFALIVGDVAGAEVAGDEK
ncbi:MAG: YabP/YqfC family sporulation protein [Corallococcus sp.]|nr:YabP/YqfC family sporulation protein [Bacillota bacterium]MCM1533896.1 YabP/YqfC family sporulation protein [Corallococcus sp.]